MRWLVRFAALWGLLLFSAGGASAINVYEVKVQSDADLLIYVVDQELLADVDIYLTKYASEGASGPGLVWYFTPLKSMAKLKVYFVQYPVQADLLVYYTDRDFKAAWLNPVKRARFSDKLPG